MKKTKKFLKKYIIDEDGIVTNTKTGETIEPKKGKVKLKTPKGKKKYSVKELLETYFPNIGKKDKKDLENIDVKEENLSSSSGTEAEEKKPASKPQQVRDYFDKDPDAFDIDSCAADLCIPLSYIKRTIETHKEKLGIKDNEPAPEIKTSEKDSINIIVEVNGLRYSINAVKITD